MSEFLPAGYEKPESGSKYYKFAQGDNIFRILSPAITGWLDWDDKTPIRTKEKPEKSKDPKKPAKHFWAFVIWDYRDEAIKILEITQATIQDAIFDLHNDENWGSPMNYDLNVKKTGEKMETKYNVIPVPPKPLSEEVQKLYNSTIIDLNELYKNGDPFKGKNETAQEEQERIEKMVENIPF